MVIPIGSKKRSKSGKKLQSNQEYDTSDVSLYTLNQYFEGPKIFNKKDQRYDVRPIIGNEHQRLLTALSWYIKRTPVVIEGESGSGKTEIFNAIVVLMFGDRGIDGENTKLYLIDSGSDKVHSRKVDVIRQAKWAIIPELQKATNHMEMIKNWGEGKKYRHEIPKGDDDYKFFDMDPLPILTCLAIGNETMKQMPNEVIRRFIHIFARASKHTNKSVLKRKGEIRALPDHELPCMDPIEQEKLVHKMVEASMEKRTIKNPYAPFINEMIPSNFTKCMSFAEHFFDLIEAITMFFRGNRHGTERYLFSTIEDNYLAVEIAGDIFVNMSLGIEDVGAEILDHMDVPSSFMGDLMGDINDDQLTPANHYYSVNDIIRLLKDELGIYRTKNIVVDVMDRLRDAGYVDIRHAKKGKKEYYYKMEDYDDSKSPKLKWSEWNVRAEEWMQKHYEEEYEEWKITNKKEYISPLTGEKKTIEV